MYLGVSVFAAGGPGPRQRRGRPLSRFPGRALWPSFWKTHENSGNSIKNVEGFPNGKGAASWVELIILANVFKIA